MRTTRQKHKSKAREQEKRHARREAKKAERPEPANLVVCQGVEGRSVYLNGLRIAGPKPWGGGEIIDEWDVALDDVREALERPNPKGDT